MKPAAREELNFGCPVYVLLGGTRLYPGYVAKVGVRIHRVSRTAPPLTARQREATISAPVGSVYLRTPELDLKYERQERLKAVRAWFGRWANGMETPPDDVIEFIAARMGDGHTFAEQVAVYLGQRADEARDHYPDSCAALLSAANDLRRVECLGWFDTNPVHRSLWAGVASEAGFYYRCKNLSPGGDCAIYDSRPDMCRGFPDYHDGVCQYADCTRRLDHQLVHVPRPVDALVVTTIDIVALARQLDERTAVVGRTAAVNEVRARMGLRQL